MVQPHSVSNREQVVDTMIELTRLSNLHRAIVAGSDSLELYLALRRRGFIRVATTATCRISKAAARHRPDHRTEHASSHRSCACADLAIPQPQRGHCRVDQLPRKRPLPENPYPAGTDGFPDRGGRPVSAGPRAFRIPAGLQPDGNRSVNTDDTLRTSRHLAGGLHPRPSHALR